MRPAGRYEGVRALVMGVGRFGGGAGAARFLTREGARVTVTDLRSAAELPEARTELSGLELEWVLGEHRARDFERAELVVANPAVSPRSEWLRLARESGARVTTEVELFLAASRCRRVAVTGTQGKSSSVRFLLELLLAAGVRAVLGGNAGGSLLDRLDDLDEDAVAVLELSSYQLEHLGAPPESARGLEAAGVTQLLDDHLERHGGREGYSAAKRRIAELLEPGRPLYLGGGLHLDPAWRELPGARPVPELPATGDLDLPGFQRSNLALALALAAAVTGRTADDLLAPRPNLSTPPHRFEELPPLGGVRVVDNGVSTTPDSTAAALRELDRPTVWLAGGQDKGLDWAPALEAARGRVRAAVCFGACAPRLTLALREAGVPAVRSRDLGPAVRLAVGLARDGDALLFSPAAASFDAYPNFLERARAFRHALDGCRARPGDGAR